jgi:hypothetical protein
VAKICINLNGTAGIPSLIISFDGYYKASGSLFFLSEIILNEKFWVRIVFYSDNNLSGVYTKRFNKNIKTREYHHSGKQDPDPLQGIIQKYFNNH